ncbi:MAG: HAMP domain-containing protein [Methylocystaceae bacterium]|nr:HAMP domain-containing protein [Methylocystaceae bacterium]
MHIINNMSVSKKILIGFGFILILLLTVSIVGYKNITLLGDDFSQYRGLALQTNQSGRVQANLLETRIYVKDFLIKASDDSINNVNNRASKTLSYLTDLKKLVTQADKLEVIEMAKKNMKTYLDTFHEVTTKQKVRNDLVHNILDKVGPEIEKNLTQVMKDAYRDHNVEVEFHAGKTLRSLLLARLYTTKFLIDNNKTAYQRTQSEFAIMQKDVQELTSTLQNPDHLKLAQKINEQVTTYQKTIQDVYQTISTRNDMINNTLDAIGPKVADEMEDLKLSIKKEQDALGPKATAAVKLATTLTLSVSVIGIIFAITAAILIGSNITKPIKHMTNAMTNLAKGDKTVVIPAIGLKNEIGDMASAVQVFKDNMIKAERLQAEQEEEQAKKTKRANAVDQMINQFREEVTETLDAMATAATTLKEDSKNLSVISEQTAQQASTVAAAAEQASSNVQTVAGSADELSASVNEINVQINESSRITESARVKTENTNAFVNQLNESVMRIGEVVNLINDIADQTNLLALNATIEAARAGEAGKGFAVVASEVKNLANQTGKATEEIGSQIKEVQTNTRDAVSAIQDVTLVITQVSEISNSIVAALEQQSAATNEIARNVQEASSGTSEVSNSITIVNTAAQNTGTSASNVRTSAEGVDQLTLKIRDKIKVFLTNVQEA